MYQSHHQIPIEGNLQTNPSTEIILQNQYNQKMNYKAQKKLSKTHTMSQSLNASQKINKSSRRCGSAKRQLTREKKSIRASNIGLSGNDNPI